MVVKYQTREECLQKLKQQYDEIVESINKTDENKIDDKSNVQKYEDFYYCFDDARFYCKQDTKCKMNIKFKIGKKTRDYDKIMYEIQKMLDSDSDEQEEEDSTTQIE